MNNAKTLKEIKTVVNEFFYGFPTALKKTGVRTWRVYSGGILIPWLVVYKNKTGYYLKRRDQ